jgi:hypothetical protein
MFLISIQNESGSAMAIPYISSTNIPWEIKQKLANYRLFIFLSVDSELVSANMSWNRWQSLEISKDGSFSSVQELLKGNTSSFWQYLYLENGSIDRPEIFISDRVSIIMRYMFEETKFSKIFGEFLENMGFHYRPLRPQFNFVRLDWTCFGRYLRLSLRGQIELFQKSHFLFFYKQNTSTSSEYTHHTN